MCRAIKALLQRGLVVRDGLRLSAVVVVKKAKIVVCNALVDSGLHRFNGV